MIEGTNRIFIEERLLRLPDVLKIVPVSKSTWWSWCAQGIAPKGIKLTEKTTAWRLSDILHFIEERAKKEVAS